MYIYGIYTGPNLVITLPAYDLAPNGARPSADTVLTDKLYVFSLKFFWLLLVPLHFYGPLTSSKMAASREISRHFER